MSTAYQPTCPACRDGNMQVFHKSCEGCRVRQANAAAQQRAPQLTKKQIDGMDSTMHPLEATKS